MATRGSDRNGGPLYVTPTRNPWHVTHSLVHGIKIEASMERRSRLPLSQDYEFCSPLLCQVAFCQQASLVEPHPGPGKNDPSGKTRVPIPHVYFFSWTWESPDWERGAVGRTLGKQRLTIHVAGWLVTRVTETETSPRASTTVTAVLFWPSVMRMHL